MFYLQEKEFSDLRKKILKKVEKKVSERRFEHIKRVEKKAVHLAKLYNANVQGAALAALMHDYAKSYPDEKKWKMVTKYSIPLNETERDNIDLIHGKIAAEIARDKFGISDEDILNAMRYHTTGRPKMSRLEKIIYVADFTEPGRKEFPGMLKARELAEIDINEALLKILILTINHLMDRQTIIDQITEATYEYYLDLHNKNIIEND